jgi:hypothetical protein
MTAPGAADSTDTDCGTYHIVCHDCPTECLTTEGTEAERLLAEHRTATGHNVEFASLGDIEIENE